MTRLDLPNPCLETLCWLESRPAEPSIALGEGCGVLSDLFKTAPTATKQQWEDWLRILDGQQAILVQLFTSRLLATSFFDPTDGLYSEWESPSRMIGSGHPWSDIVSMGWPGHRFKKALIKGDIRPHLKRTYQQLTANHPTLVQPKDICRICLPRIRLTEHGKMLVAWAREARSKQPFVAPEPLVFTDRQERVLAALDGVALKAEALAINSRVSRRDLFNKGRKKGVLPELIAYGRVKRLPRRGYYRPDKPPPEIRDANPKTRDDLHP